MTSVLADTHITANRDAKNAVGDPEIELIFLGTGTSSSIPLLHCLTAPADQEPCRTCLSTRTAEGKKNIRRNTSAVIRVNGGKDGKKKTVVIDVGKNFLAAAIEWFPKYGLREIDAVLITHAHADAMNGLDDLGGWTLGGAIQEHIDVYLSQDGAAGAGAAGGGAGWLEGMGATCARRAAGDGGPERGVGFDI